MLLYSLFQLQVFGAIAGLIQQRLGGTLSQDQLMRVAAVAMLPKTGLLAVFTIFPLIYIPAMFTWFMTLSFIAIGIHTTSQRTAR